MSRGRPASEPRLIREKAKRRNPLFFIYWHDGERRRKRSTGTGERAEANKIFARWLLDHEDRERGFVLSPRYPHEVAIIDILDAYAEARTGEVRFPDRINYAIMRLAAWWQNRRVDAVRPETCRAYRDARLAEGVQVATVTKELSVLRAALKWAKKNGRLVSAPDVETPPKQPGGDRWLTVGEAARLLSAARQEPKSRLHLPLFILIALYTGARTEAILTLRWFPQVNLERGVIDFNPPGRARNKKGRATIRIPAKLRWFLERARARASSPYVLNYHGEPIKQIKHSFANACKRAGLAEVTPHTLRHTCATWQAQAGVSLHQIGGWLGHSDPRTTQIYAHHHPDHFRDSLAALERRSNKRA